VVKCPKDWLLTCAFFELPLTGSFFHLYHPENDQFYDFEAITDTDEIESEEEESIHKQDSNIKSINLIGEESSVEEEKSKKSKRKYNKSDSSDSSDSEKPKKKILSDKRLSPRHSRNQKPKNRKSELKISSILSDYTVKESFRKSIDKRYLSNHYHTSLDLENYLDLFVYLTSRGEKKEYLQSIKNMATNPFYSNISVVHKTVSSGCRCGMDDSSPDIHENKIQNRFNNLICDFSKQKLVIEDLAPHKWRVNINILGLSGFNHASCQCEISRTEYVGCTIQYSGTTKLNHIVIRKKNKREFETGWFPVGVL